MRCPKCGTDQPEASECSACGVIIAKAADRVRPPQRRHPRVNDSQSSSKTWVWVAGFGVLVLCGLFWGIASLREEDPEPTSAPAVTPVPGPEQAGPQADPEPARTPPTPARRSGIELERESVPAVSVTWYEGADGWAQAQTEQRRNGAPLALYVRVGWCPHCRHFEEQVLPDATVKTHLERVIKVRLDPDRDQAEKELASKLGVTGYPTFQLIADPGGESRELPAGSSVDAATFAKMLDEHLAHIARAWSESVSGQVSDEALATLDRAVRLAPNDAWTFIGRGMHLTRRRAYGQAEEDLRHATRLAPDEPTGHDALGWCLMEQNRFDDALLVYDHLSHIATGPVQARAIYMRGVCHKKLGRSNPAVKDARTACQLGHAPACKVLGRK